MHEGAPLISGYIFAKLEDLELIHQSRIMYLPELYEVPERMMVEIFGAHYGTPQDPYTEGSKVRVKSGPFAHREAILKSRKGDVLTLILSMFGQPQEIPLSMKDVEAA